jgi:hypothetical protein
VPSTGTLGRRRHRPGTGVAQLSGRCLHRLVGREETDLAIGHLRSELGARLTEEFAGVRSRRKDCFHQVAEVRGVLDERLGVPVPLVDDALGLIVVEVDVVLQRSGVLDPHDVHTLSGQSLELLKLALVEPEPSDALKLAQPSGLRTFALLAGVGRSQIHAERHVVTIDPRYDGP